MIAESVFLIYEALQNVDKGKQVCVIKVFCLKNHRSLQDD